uniref:YopX protein n=1 Tax=Siphoviridae sp. ctXYk3 TaxID=2827886 RepID=A0A8S5T4E9_9CAUD|nr:MAG TPA: YopX protein [Siphoviridae sp. ctXYk3]DAK24486.1 MAG TPA: YopX protein [Caudoviricetes sp.]
MIPRYRVWCKIFNTMIKSMTIQKMIYQRNSSTSIASLYDDFVFMQSTGLRDKNANEIYIGDIVRGVRPNLDNETERIETKGVVKESCCEVVIEDEKETHDPFENYFAIVYQSGKAEIEVIGNIYENPELMEV